jgi:hypothetical protein
MLRSLSMRVGEECGAKLPQRGLAVFVIGAGATRDPV